MLKAIRTFGHPILSQTCVPIVDIQFAAQIAQDLRDTLKKHKIGVGIAAPQIGYPYRVVLITNDKVLINPKIVSQSGSQDSEEGCLSYPNMFAKIKRPESIVVKYLNENMEEAQETFVGYQAIVCCHELDHLDGRCILSRKTRKKTA